jgi:hypothetical protein
MIGNSQVVVEKTASYQIVAGDCAAFFTNRGAAGSISFTLPAATELRAGWWCEFYVVVGFSIVIASSPVDRLTVHGDATADTLTLPGTIGQHARVVYDGTGFLVIPDPSSASAATSVTAVTIAT